MKSVLIFLALIAFTFAQAPSLDPNTTSCKPTSWCRKSGETCNSTSAFGQNPFYCTSETFCDLTAGNCAARLKKDATCVPAEAGCETGLFCNPASNKCEAPPTVAPGTPPPFAWEDQGCNATMFCYPGVGLVCVDSKCVKAYSGKVDDSCAGTSCKPDLFCSAGKCKEYAKPTGTDCILNSDCDLANGQVCFCKEPNKIAGVCAGVAVPVDTCKTEVTAFVGSAKITSATATAAYTCASTCLLNFQQTNVAAWKGYNGVNNGAACAWTPFAKTCGGAPTSGATTPTGSAATAGSSDASSVVISFAVVFIAVCLAMF
jgi:hypothetical protein